MTMPGRDALVEGAESAEIIRLRQKLAARDEVIVQLNRQVTNGPAYSAPAVDEDPDLQEELTYKVRELEAEVVRLRGALDAESQRAAQLHVRTEELTAQAASTATARRGWVRRAGAAVKRRVRR